MSSIQGAALGLCGCREAGCSVFSDPSHNSAARRLRAGKSEGDLEGGIAGTLAVKERCLGAAFLHFGCLRCLRNRQAPRVVAPGTAPPPHLRAFLLPILLFCFAVVVFVTFLGVNASSWDLLSAWAFLKMCLYRLPP